MRRLLRAIGGLLAALTVVYAYFALLHPHGRVADHPFFESSDRMVIAHRGGRGRWPENTLYAFRHALAMGADVLEMDVRATSDGTLVLMHDETVDRTTNGLGKVSNFRVDEWRKLDAAYKFREANGFPLRGHNITPPTFEEVLLALPDTRLNVEMKQLRPEQIRDFCELIQQTGMTDNVLVGSFEHAPMLQFRKECPRVATSATLREAFLFYQLSRFGLVSVYRSPAVALQVPEKFGDIDVLQPVFLQRATEQNIRVQVWTVNEAADMKRLLEIGVQGILTDYPDVLLRALGRQTRASAAPHGSFP